jgi:hypothetical protein
MRLKASLVCPVVVGDGWMIVVHALTSGHGIDDGRDGVILGEAG